MKKTILLAFCCLVLIRAVPAHEIYFCNEKVNIDKEIAAKLIQVIRLHANNIYTMRRQAMRYFPIIEQYLAEHHLPSDLKYLPVVESGFRITSSAKGARGFWQLMPETAREYGMVVSSVADDRDDIHKATSAACRLLDDYNRSISQKVKTASWLLTVAAYNCGVNRILKTIATQGDDFFGMTLNSETSLYIYKLIAVKELFENPELYMKDFGYNVFNTPPPEQVPGTADMKALIREEEQNKEMAAAAPLFIDKEAQKVKAGEFTYISAHLSEALPHFSDGGFVSLVLDEDLNTNGVFIRKGNEMTGIGWIIDGRINIDLGIGEDVLLFDGNGVKGIQLDKSVPKQPLLIKVLENE